MISNRLQAIAAFIPPAKRIVDVGCDHGYIIIEAFQKYQIESAVALDNKAGPLSKAFNNIRGYGFFDRVNFVLSECLEQFYAQADAFILSGMGGLNIINIINNGLDKLGQARLIIQANRHAFEVRTYLTNQGYYLVNEELIFEGGKYYEIELFEKTEEPVFYHEDELYFGPLLLARKSEIFMNKLRHDLRILKAISHPMPKHLKTIKRIEEILC